MLEHSHHQNPLIYIHMIMVALFRFLMMDDEGLMKEEMGGSEFLVNVSVFVSCDETHP